MMRCFILNLVLLFTVYGQEYEFTGIHYIASFIDCDQAAMCHLHQLRDALERGVEASGATLLGSCEHIFPPDSITLVLLLSESHASIHTYPEHSSCYVDLFTCGDRCDYREFQRVLEDYLKPQTLETTILRR